MTDSPTDAERAKAERLTAKERECLVRWLGHATAKEIALELGVTHHAVEKRLKSARQKLDAASSIEAARILARVEGWSDERYGQTASCAPDLVHDRERPDNGRHVAARRGIAGFLRHPATIPGVIIMTIFIAALALAATQQISGTVGAGTPTDAEEIVGQAGGTMPARGEGISGSVGARPGEPDVATVYVRADGDIGRSIARTFARLDRDGSGTIEAEEIEATPFIMVQPSSQGAEPSQAARASSLAEADGDQNGQVTQSEYRVWLTEQLEGAASHTD